MIPLIEQSLKPLGAEDLRFLARCAGPCVTIRTPDFQPGAQSGWRYDHLRPLIQTLQERLEHLNLPDAAGLVSAVEETANFRELDRGGPGVTLFCSSTTKAVYETPGVLAEEMFIGKRFHLLPALAAAMAPQEFTIVTVSRNAVRLIAYAQGRCRELPLPPGMPRNLDEAGAFNAPDHDLENRSSAGTGMKVRFSTLSDREAARSYLHKFFRLIDDGLQRASIHGAVMLMGVREELAEFRRAAHHANIFESEVYGNADRKALDEIARDARRCALKESYRAGETAAAEFAEVPPAQKIAGDVVRIVKAASDGRCRVVLVPEGAGMPARATDLLAFSDLLPGEDLINVAVVETLRHGGEALMVPGDEIRGAGALAALLRY